MGKGRDYSFGQGLGVVIALILLVGGCAPKKPPSLLSLPMPSTFTAWGSFGYKSPQTSLHGMWMMEYKGDGDYQLSIYSNIGTLEACLLLVHGAPRPCKEGLRGKEILDTLPPEVWEVLPWILLGRLRGSQIQKDTKGRTKEAIIALGDRGIWRVSFHYYLEAEGVPYPTLVKVQGERVSLKIRVEEMKPGLPP